jgi:hypothetical protein
MINDGKNKGIEFSDIIGSMQRVQFITSRASLQGGESKTTTTKNEDNV